MRQAAIRTGPGVNKNHGNWRPTSAVREALEAKFPTLEFPYLDTDHTHGVHSSVHCYCPKHQTFTRIGLAGALYEKTQYACSICATIAGVKTRKANGFSTKQYIGKPGVQSGIFRAIKAEFPDAEWEHTMECGKEIDIWIPSIQTGIEYNGNYYHSTECKTDPNYHVNKSAHGLSENKMIHHVFTDEAEFPYSNVVDQLACRVRHRVVATHNYAAVSPEVALAFHKAHNYIFHQVLDFADLHFGAYVGGDLVAVISGRSVSRKIFYLTTLNMHTPIIPMVELFAKKTKWVKKSECHVSVDMRNPTALLWCALSKLKKGGGSGPVCYALTDRYEVDWDNQPEDIDSSDAAKIYDCGYLYYLLP